MQCCLINGQVDVLSNSQEASFFLVLELQINLAGSRNKSSSHFLVFFPRNAFPVKSTPLRYRFDEKVMNAFTTVLPYPKGKQREITIRISACYFLYNSFLCLKC